MRSCKGSHDIQLVVKAADLWESFPLAEKQTFEHKGPKFLF
jgi:hypothetical protein